MEYRLDAGREVTKDKALGVFDVRNVFPWKKKKREGIQAFSPLDLSSRDNVLSPKS